MFQADKEKAQPSGANYLQVPYKGPVSFKSFEKKKVGNTEKCFVAEAKLLGEDIQGNDCSGITKEYVEWNPEGKGDKKTENAVNRLAYFASHLAPPEEVFDIKAESWEEYVDKTIMLLNQHSAKDRDDIEMKFVGSVYQGNPKITTPGYHSFIANQDSENSLEWSQGEQQDNREYLEVKNSSPTNPEEAEKIEDLGNQSF